MGIESPNSAAPSNLVSVANSYTCTGNGTGFIANANRATGGQSGLIIRGSGAASDTTIGNDSAGGLQFILAGGTVALKSNFLNLPVVSAGYQIAGVQVVGPQIVGYGSPLNAARQVSFDAATINLLGLAQAVAYLIIDLKTHGLLGA